MANFLKSIKMTTAILMLVIGSIVFSILAVSVSIYAALHDQSRAESRSQQQTNIAVAATILERRISGSVLSWGDRGAMESFQTWAIPPLDVKEVDAVTRVTKQDAAIFVVDVAKPGLFSTSTSLIDSSGERIIDLIIGEGHPAYQALMKGEQYVGNIELNGADYFGAMLPIEKMSAEGAPAEIVGAILVATPNAAIEAAANGILGLILFVGGAATLTLAVIGFVLSRLITRPVPRLAFSMEKIARGEFDAEVPYTDRQNEVGAMARAVEIFRENGMRVSQMTEADAIRVIADEEERKRMMWELQAAFGEVVDAAIAGDFRRKVEVDFPDAELNSLAASINSLVSTFDRAVSEMGGVLAAMADTDLTQRMTGQYDGALASLKNDVNAVADKLSDVIGKLRHASGSLKSATGEILSGANDLSERTTRQAATIEETSATMEQLASTVGHNALRAREASANAGQVTKTAEEGGRVMEAANLAMKRITQSSAKISNIIGMIDDIAFQTNLLALNASVEAARAGDAGKGFAVVAVEVRRLAQSAAQASSEVKALIEQSAGEVLSGSKLVGEAASKLELMLEAVRSNSGLLDSIANDSREQASAIEQITTAVRTMDEMTQHNAALVEETNAAIEQTEAQASELDRIVEVFRIRPAAVPRAAAPHVPGAGRATVAVARELSRGNLALASDWEDF